MEVLEKQTDKGSAVSVCETRTEKAFRTQKLSFLAGMSFLQKVQGIMSGVMDPEQISIAVSQPFMVRSETGYIFAHCADCYRAKFVTEVPA